jgi:hypothetical protein
MAPRDTDDDDFDPGPVPGPDAEPTATEKARARSFAELIDKVVTGRTPAAMSPQDRALVETATIIRAGAGKVELPAARASALVEAALRGGIAGGGAPAPADVPASIPIDRARRSRTPWIVAAVSSTVAAAAIVLLFLRPAPQTQTQAAQPHAAAPPATWLSRPADGVVGVIPQARAGEAASRIDAIFADRLDGYRERTLSRGGR